jgi:hypothetical protein
MKEDAFCVLFSLAKNMVAGVDWEKDFKKGVGIMKELGTTRWAGYLMPSAAVCFGPLAEP